MKTQILAASLLALSSAAFAQAGVSINVGEPGFYGRLDIGGYPQPQVIYDQPVIIDHTHPVPAAPVYLRVPVEYTHHWADHCREYNACGEKVFFVNDHWYANEYAPRYRNMHARRDDRHDDDHH